MRHFIAYHNTEKMGRSLHDDEPLWLLTNKHGNNLLQNTIWFITGEGAGTRQYSLGSVPRCRGWRCQRGWIQAIRVWSWPRIRASHSN